MHKGEAEVVIHQVEGIAHFPGHLVDEAENALVVAGVDLVAEIMVEREAGGFIFTQSRSQSDDFGMPLDDKSQRRLSGLKLIVQDVENRTAVNLADQVAD